MGHCKVFSSFQTNYTLTKQYLLIRFFFILYIEIFNPTFNQKKISYLYSLEDRSETNKKNNKKINVHASFNNH